MSAPLSAGSNSAGHKHKQPQPVFDNIFAFAPNRETMGGSAYLITEKDASGKAANILVDCPALNEINQAFITDNGGIQTLFITHRGGMAQVPEFQKAFGLQIVIQEQEAYLLPTLQVETFHRDRTISPLSRVFWNPGHSPGSASLYHSAHGGVLFSGRHLLPTRQGTPAPLRLSKTFHWPRQIRYARKLLADFDADCLSYICPGASTGFLRGEKKIDRAYEKLAQVDWGQLAASPAIL